MSRPVYERGITRREVSRSQISAGMRISRCRVVVPEAARTRVAALVSGWELKRRVGFETPAASPVPGERLVLAKRMFGVRFAEPIRIVWASETGFGYETLPGHPFWGEESYLLDEDGLFVACSVSQPSGWFWWMGAPVLWLLQRRTLRSYVRVVRAECIRDVEGA